MRVLRGRRESQKFFRWVVSFRSGFGGRQTEAIGRRGRVFAAAVATDAGQRGRGESIPQLDRHKMLQTFQILAVQLHVVVTGSLIRDHKIDRESASRSTYKIRLTHLDPQGLHGFRALVVNGNAVREVDHLVFCPVNDQHRRCDIGNFVNTV